MPWSAARYCFKAFSALLRGEPTQLEEFHGLGFLAEVDASAADSVNTGLQTAACASCCACTSPKTQTKICSEALV